MAEFETRTILEAQATVTFNEIGLRALDAMTGYGADAFLEVFYQKLGKAYMEPYEEGSVLCFRRSTRPSTKPCAVLMRFARSLRRP